MHCNIQYIHIISFSFSCYKLKKPKNEQKRQKKQQQKTFDFDWENLFFCFPGKYSKTCAIEYLQLSSLLYYIILLSYFTQNVFNLSMKRVCMCGRGRGLLLINSRPIRNIHSRRPFVDFRTYLHYLGILKYKNLK